MARNIQTLAGNIFTSGYSGASGLSGYTGLSGYSGSGTVAVSNDTATNSTYYPVWVTTNSGSLSTVYVTDSKLTFNPSTGTLSATEINSLSDQTLKTNIMPIEDALNLVNQISGVNFNWNDTGKTSAGVLAQDLEKVLPHLVNEVNGLKTVNYNGLIAVMLEAIKLLAEKSSSSK